MTLDMINGLIELCGAMMLSNNIFALHRDKEIKGIHWSSTVFFTLWGIFNLFYYPSLDQWYSFFGGIAIVVVNTIWLSMIIYYKTRKDVCTNSI
jgi:hypothetical protein